MSQFTTRVELHNANYQDYQNLHSYMEAEGFSRTIQDDTTKVYYYLPTAEYNYGNSAIDDKNTVLNKAINAANRTNRAHCILVTKSDARTWSNLTPVK